MEPALVAGAEALHHGAIPSGMLEYVGAMVGYIN